MVKSNVRVFVRTRPTATIFDGFKVAQDSASVAVNLPKNEEAGLINNQQESFAFKFDGVLENVSQETTYTTVAHEVVDSLLAGYNGTIFAYGQTGAGKTFTMAGDLRNYAHRGIIPRSIHHVFREIDMRMDKMYKVQVSYLEIYNEQMYDLLSDNPGTSDSLAILEDATTGTYVRGLSRVEVHSEEEALAQYFIGEQGRSTARHVLNSSSSRSHCIFSIYLEMRTSDSANERAVLSKLHLVDLAGSERTKKTNVTGQALKEAQFINRSLSFLEQSVNALSRHESHVPYRSAKLTSVLRDALGGNCKTVMVANLWAEPSHMEETLSTLRFASRVRTLVTDVGVNESSDPSLLVRRYERQIRELKQELAMKDTLSGKGRTNYEDLGEAELRELNQLVKKFLQGEADVDDLPVDSLKRIKETYKAMRGVYQTMRSELAASAGQQAAAGAGTAAAEAGSVPGSFGDAVGDVDREQRGFQIGLAPSDSRPAPRTTTTAGGMSASPPALAASRSFFSTVTGDHGPGSPLPRDPSMAGFGSPGLGATFTLPGGAERNAAFARFKHDDPNGRQLNLVVKERLSQLKDVKVAVKEIGAAVNALKARIDALNAQLTAKKSEPQRPSGGPAGTGGDAVVDAEQYAVLQDLKAAKASYRSEFDKLKDLRSSLEPLMQSVAESKQMLVDEFNKWVGQQATGAFGPMAGGDDEEELDAGEAFERMQLERIVAADPDSGPYHAALKKGGAVARSSGQFAGIKAQAEAIRKKEQEAMINAGLMRV